jgi:hypothetical protein
MSQPLLSPDVVVVLNGAQALHDELRR